MSQRMLKWGGVLAPLALLVGMAIHLAFNRLYQVDEAQNLFMVRALAFHQGHLYFTNALLWMMGPLGWLARSAEHAVDLFAGGRAIFLGVFWLNLLLLALNTGERLRTFRGGLVLLAAATLAPLWDFGFEIRHDNLLLTGLLLLWWLGRARPGGSRSYLLLGALGAWLPLLAFKAVAYVVPLSLAFLAFPPPGHGLTRKRAAGAWGLGFLLGALLAGIAYKVSGTGGLFLEGLRAGVATGEGGSRFGPMVALERLPLQIPLILSLAAAGLVQLALGWRRDRSAVLRWEGPLPEALLSLGSLVLLALNPTPFPYNLVVVVPFLFLLAHRTVEPHLEGGWAKEEVRPLLGGVVLFTHLLPFGLATARHLQWPNTRQEALMRAAEVMTDPATDPVYDAVGMVPTRASIGYHWYLHSLNIQAFAEGRIPPVSKMLTDRPAPVLIRSYRMDWLPESEQRFLAERYVPLADDFWVLGGVLPEGGGTYEVVHPGRYLLLGMDAQGAPAPEPGGQVDGKPAGSTPIRLERGTHQIRMAPGLRPTLLWVGPKLQGLPRLGGGDHLQLFVNWY